MGDREVTARNCVEFTASGGTFCGECLVFAEVRFEAPFAPKELSEVRRERGGEREGACGALIAFDCACGTLVLAEAEAEGSDSCVVVLPKKAVSIVGGGAADEKAG
jgi:hypothetical protein